MKTQTTTRLGAIKHGSRKKKKKLLTSSSLSRDPRKKRINGKKVTTPHSRQEISRKKKTLMAKLMAVGLAGAFSSFFFFFSPKRFLSFFSYTLLETEKNRYFLLLPLLQPVLPRPRFRVGCVVLIDRGRLSDACVSLMRPHAVTCQ